MAFLDDIKQGCIEGWATAAILPSISGAQACLESGWGSSTLAKSPNHNLFGIKGNYNGASVTVPTKEFVNGAYITVDAAFRKYPSWAESIADHGNFFSSTAWRKSNYLKVIGETDYKKAAQALSDAGYATDPDYPSKLIAIIEANGLAQWDMIEESAKVVKVYISPSSQQDNVGVGNFGTEETRMNQIADVVESELKRCGIVTLRNNPNMDITQMVSASNNFGADVHLAIHSNAGGATGAEAYYYTGSAAGQKLAKSVYDNISPMTPTADRGIKATTVLYEVWATNAVATLVEIAFHDNAADANFIINNIQAIGVALAKGVCSYLGVNFGSTSTPTVTTTAQAVETVGPVRNPVSYNAVIKSGGYSIDSKPWGEPGFTNWGTTDGFLGQTVPVSEENASGEYINTSLGWIDKRAVEKEPVVVSSTLHLPAGQTWITYPENGPYKAGNVIAVEQACSCLVLGDKGQGLIVVDLEGGVGRVAIRYDESKGASIEKKYA